MRKESRQVIGAIDCFDYDITNRKAAIGLLIDPGHKRQGFGRDALTLRDGASVTLLIGDYSEAGEGDYLSLSGSDTVYLVAASARTAITNNLNTCYMEASDAE